MTTVSIQETYRAMAEIMDGEQEPSVLLAFWASALSPRVPLHLNCHYTRLVAQYVVSGLPEREVLLDELGRKPGNKLPPCLMGSHIDLLYTLENLYRQGVLNFDTGTSLEAQQAWREKMVALIPGMGCKLVSWALFIYNPLYCNLLTIDCWHCKRLGIEHQSVSGSSQCKRVAYLGAEKRMLSECRALYPEYPPVITAAMLWQNARLSAGMSATNGYQSHRDLSCRIY